VQTWLELGALGVGVGDDLGPKFRVELAESRVDRLVNRSSAP